jgi:starch synthase
VFGLDDSYFNEHMLKIYNDVCLMKGAIYASDYVTTVSPNYAHELQYSFYAHGLEGVVTDNRQKIAGILNGIDMAANDPSTGVGITAPFSTADLSGKAACKESLQEQLGLKKDPNVPIIACISRLVGHKGFELITQAFNSMMDLDVQFVVLGTGEWDYEQFFRNAQIQYPGKVSANILYSASLSSAIYAGADVFLMPSIAEPCGLSQMFAMRYGTVPVVRTTGGLLDSVPPYEPAEDSGLGFTFGTVNAQDMLDAIRRAVALYHDEPEAWKRLMQRDMEADFSWDRSALEYQKVYEAITQ